MSIFPWGGFVAGLTLDAAQWCAAHHGIITADQLGDRGVSRSARRTLVDRGLLIGVAKGVYRLASTPDSPHARALVACLAHPGGFITGVTGGRLVGLRRMGKDLRVHFSTPHGWEVASPGLVLRQSTRIDDTDWRRRDDGIVLASPPRLAFDLARDLTDFAHASVVEQMIDTKLCSLGALARIADRLVHPNRPGSRRFLRTLAQRIPGTAMQSDGELRLARLMAQRGVPVQTQHALVPASGGESMHLDLAVPSVRWGIEIDLHPSHLLLEGTAADKRRDRRAHLVDWQIERVTALDFVDLEACADEMLELYLLRCRRLDSRSEVHLAAG
jgi:hypothetical protein